MAKSECSEYFEDDIKTGIEDKTTIFLVKKSCDICKKVFKSKVSLRNHIQIHKEIKYPCTQCEYKATQKGHLKKHIHSFHEKSKILLNL